MMASKELWNKIARIWGEPSDTWSLRIYRLGFADGKAAAQKEDKALAAPPAAANQAGIPEGWISINERLPEEREAAYQVIVVCAKEYDGNYKGKGLRRFMQDWVVRRWPQNFTHWMPAMDWPAAAPHTESHALGGGDVAGNGEGV